MIARAPIAPLVLIAPSAAHVIAPDRPRGLYFLPAQTLGGGVAGMLNIHTTNFDFFWILNY